MQPACKPIGSRPLGVPMANSNTCRFTLEGQKVDIRQSARGVTLQSPMSVKPVGFAEKQHARRSEMRKHK
jgi:hypothetical protein